MKGCCFSCFLQGFCAFIVEFWSIKLPNSHNYSTACFNKRQTKRGSVFFFLLPSLKWLLIVCTSLSLLCKGLSYLNAKWTGRFLNPCSVELPCRGFFVCFFGCPVCEPAEGNFTRTCSLKLLSVNHCLPSSLFWGRSGLPDPLLKAVILAWMAVITLIIHGAIPLKTSPCVVFVLRQVSSINTESLFMVHRRHSFSNFILDWTITDIHPVPAGLRNSRACPSFLFWHSLDRSDPFKRGTV